VERVRQRYLLVTEHAHAGEDALEGLLDRDHEGIVPRDYLGNRSGGPPA
jgi:hypothetical protein